MNPAARTQAAIELLDAIVTSARDGGAAADVLIARYFAARRYAGSKDRRAVRALVYDAIRLCGERPENGREAMRAVAAVQPEVAATFDGSTYGPAVIAQDERAASASLVPDWLARRLRLDEGELAALLGRAPLDVRVNRLKDGAIDLPGAEPIDGLPDALRLPPDTQVERSAALAEGLIEIQDAGSQFVTNAAEAKSGMTVVDLCAGGGGKTLALAAAMENSGRIIASDTDRARLSRLAPRAERAGATIAETRLLDPGRERDALTDVEAAADVVLIDAPCSGTGTWRRNPEARWRLTPARVKRLVDTQARLLDLGATLVRPGGALVYIVCSLLDDEGAGQVKAFLTRYPAWTAAKLALGAGRPHGVGTRLTPASDQTDGFFVARLISPC